MERRLLLSFATLILSAGLYPAAFADTFTLTLAKANQSAIPGATLSYSGTITYTSSTPGNIVNLDGIEFTTIGFSYIDSNPSCLGNMPCIDESPFIFGAPFTLAANSSYTGVLFNVDVPPSSAITASSGFVDITGDVAGTSLTSNIVAFSSTVTPEPSSWLLMATGLLGLAIASRLRPRAASLLTRL